MARGKASCHPSWPPSQYVLLWALPGFMLGQGQDTHLSSSTGSVLQISNKMSQQVVLNYFRFTPSAQSAISTFSYFYLFTYWGVGQLSALATSMCATAATVYTPIRKF